MSKWFRFGLKRVRDWLTVSNWHICAENLGGSPYCNDDCDQSCNDKEKMQVKGNAILVQLGELFSWGTVLAHTIGLWLMSPMTCRNWILYIEVIIWSRLYQNGLTHFDKISEPTLVKWAHQTTGKPHTTGKGILVIWAGLGYQSRSDGPFKSIIHWHL